jgi:hypothetical protein
VRRLGRILLRVARGVSLALCVAALGLWVRSYRGGGDTITLVGTSGVEVVSSRGELVVETYRGWGGGSAWRWVRGESPLREGAGTYEECGRSWRGFGVGCAVTSSSGGRGVGHHWVRVPHWYAALVLAVLPVGRRALKGRR